MPRDANRRDDAPEPQMPRERAAELVGDDPSRRVSSRLYQRFEDIAGGAPVDMSAVHTTVANLADELKSTPMLSRLVKEIGEQGAEIPVSKVHDLIKKATAILRKGDATTRYTGGDIVEALHQAMEAAIPTQKPLLAAANAAWKQERGVEAMQALLTPGRSIISQK